MRIIMGLAVAAVATGLAVPMSASAEPGSAAGVTPAATTFESSATAPGLIEGRSYWRHHWHHWHHHRFWYRHHYWHRHHRWFRHYGWHHRHFRY